MANADHLELLKQGVKAWNQWRICNLGVDVDLSAADLSAIDLSGANLQGTNLRKANLSQVNLMGSMLVGADLSNANLTSANLTDAYLRYADLFRVDLRKADLCGSNLSRVNLREANLREANLSGADLSYTDLSGANLMVANLTEVDLNNSILVRVSLIGANLSNVDLIGLNLSKADLRCADLSSLNLIGVDLSGADLSSANLRQAQVLGTQLDDAILTGACLEDWNVNSSTSFEGVICEYAYLKDRQQERRPRKGIFKPGEFATLFQQALDTVDLIFKDGIDWQAFFQSFQDLRSQYAAQDLSIQAIEKKRGGAFVVRIEVAGDADKSAIESSAKQLYEAQLKALEAQYEKQLRLAGEQHSAEIQRLIAAERQEKATLMGVLTTMANNQGPKYDLSNAQFAGGFAETVQGDQVGGTINNQAVEKPSLAEAAAEIQELLKQLEQTAPAETMTQKMTLATQAITQIEANPTFKQRAVAALTVGGVKAFEKAIDHPAAAFVVGAVEEWKKS